MVTGAPGWLGTRFVELLTQGGAYPGQPRPSRVTCLVQPGRDPGPLTAWGVRVVVGDVRDRSALQAALRGADTVFHLAGLIHPRRIRELYEVNTHGTQAVLEEAVRAGVRRFVYVSSNSPAGLNPRLDHTFTEDDPPRPYMHYGRSKWLAEQAVLGATRAGLIEGVVVRPCWFYGPGQPERQTTLFRMIRRGRAVIFGDGRQRRSMSYIDNTVQGLIRAAVAPQAVGQIYWIADARPYPVREIYETIADLLGVNPFRPVFVPRLVSKVCRWADALIQATGLYNTYIHVAGEMGYSIACSIEKARRELGYDPQVDLREGMRRSIEWCRAQGIEL